MSVPMVPTASVVWILLVTAQLCSAHEVCCYESLLLPAGTTDFDIQYCPLECFYCHGIPSDFTNVFWDDEHGHHGTASRNEDRKTYKVSFQDHKDPGQHNLSVTYEYYCVKDNLNWIRKDIKTWKTLNMYGANVTHYTDDDYSDHLTIECNTGISGVANSFLTMNITLYSANIDTACSVICNNKPQLPCDWNNVTWIESNGMCSATINAPTTADAGYYCCEVNSKVNTYSPVIVCDSVSVIGGKDITPIDDPSNNNSHNILIDSTIAVASLILLVVLVITTAVFIWRRRHRDDYEEVEGHNQCEDGGRCVDGGPMSL